MRKLASIQCVEKASGGNEAPWIILFHGFGADAYDLSGLSDAFQTPLDCNWLFPQGLMEVPIGPGWTGRAWWPISLAAFEALQNQGKAADLSQVVPDGLPNARKKVMEMIDALKVPWENIVLGGFSQGAMLATDIYLHAPNKPRGLLALSGALINSTEWRTLAKNRAGDKFFQSHGVNDPVLSIRGAQQLETLLTQAGMKGRLFSFQGNHEINLDVVAKANDYLKEILS